MVPFHSQFLVGLRRRRPTVVWHRFPINARLGYMVHRSGVNTLPHEQMVFEPVLNPGAEENIGLIPRRKGSLRLGEALVTKRRAWGRGSGAREGVAVSGSFQFRATPGGWWPPKSCSLYQRCTYFHGSYRHPVGGDPRFITDVPIRNEFKTESYCVFNRPEDTGDVPGTPTNG